MIANDVLCDVCADVLFHLLAVALRKLEAALYSTHKVCQASIRSSFPNLYRKSVGSDIQIFTAKQRFVLRQQGGICRGEQVLVIEFRGMTLNGLFCADALRPFDLVSLTDFTYKYHPKGQVK